MQNNIVCHFKDHNQTESFLDNTNKASIMPSIKHFITQSLPLFVSFSPSDKCKHVETQISVQACAFLQHYESSCRQLRVMSW